MRRVDALPSPRNWNNGLSPLAKFGFLVFVGGVVYSLAQAVVALQRGAAPAALAAGGMAVFFAGAVAAVATTWLAPARMYATTDDRGTTLRANPFAIWCFVISLIGAAFGSAFYLAFVARGVAELPFTTPGRDRVTRYLMISLLVLSLIGLVALLRRRGAGYLRIGPAGVENADIVRTHTARWADVVDVTDKADSRARNPVVFVLKDTKPIIVPNADGYEPHFGALYWMIRHYWKHPESRDELTDGRALERLHNEQFEPE